MLLRLSRLSTGLAAAAAGLMVFGPVELRPLGADLALALAAAAFLLWRLAAVLERRLAQPVEPALPPLHLGAIALADARAAVGRAIAAAPSFEAALLDAGTALRGELGARQVRIYRVDAPRHPPTVSELLAERPGFHAPARALTSGASLLARALGEGRPCLDLPRAVALPVLHRGIAVAALELADIDLAVEEKALAELMAVAGAGLAARADAPLPVELSGRDSTAAMALDAASATRVVGPRSC